MLCMAVSDIDTSNHDEPIFIERNSLRFQYVLDYMRDDSFSLDSLTTTVSRDAFFDDMEYYGFQCDHDMYFPKDVKYADGVQYHHIKWDVTQAARGLVFECKNRVVKRDHDSGVYFQSVMGTVGFTVGTHFWSIEIMEDGKGEIFVGVSDILNVTESKRPGYKTTSGSSSDEIGVRYSICGQCWHGLHNIFSFGPGFGKGDVIGTLINMDYKTVTFYKNSVRVGTAANADILTGKKYFPCVSFCSDGQEIRSVGYNKIFTDDEKTSNNTKA